MNLNAFAVYLALAALALVSSVAARGEVAESAYDYPIRDRWVATVVGTPSAYEAELPDNMPLEKRRLRVFPDRVVPDVLWYAQDLLYSVALQEESAPLIFVIAGTGAGHDGQSNRMLAKAFYQAGFHVVSLSSPTYPNFVVAGSSTGVIGHPEKDAQDLYYIMELVRDSLRDRVDISSFHLTGYSLGGFNAAFLAHLDEARGSFDFEKVLLINPPVSLYNAISILDRMTENIPGGVDNFNQFAAKLMDGLTRIYTQTDDVFANDILYRAYQTLGLKDEELAALIGTSFRLSSASLVFTADVMADYGYIKPRGLVLDRNSDLTIYDALATRLNFTDYYHEFFYPYYREEFPHLSRDEFIAAASLESLEPYLRGASKIHLIHNEDDIILSRGDIDYLETLFGSRAKIYPSGGHCGNMSHRDNVAHMLGVFTTVARP